MKRRQRAEQVAAELLKQSAPQMRAEKLSSPVIPFIASARERNELTEIIRRLERLTVSHRSPEQLHIDKSEIVFELRKLAGTGTPKSRRTAGRGMRRSGIELS